MRRPVRYLPWLLVLCLGSAPPAFAEAADRPDQADRATRADETGRVAPPDPADDTIILGTPSFSFFNGYRYHLNAASLLGPDANERFFWEADVGGDLDVLDYGRGRFNFLFNYEAILGKELQLFDPNQGNYTLDLSTSWRFAQGEVFGVFHHVSRHLGDRAKEVPIDWNMMGVRYLHVRDVGRLRVESDGVILWTTARSFVDYEVKVIGRLSGRYHLKDTIHGIASVEITTIGVDRSVAGRDTQRGGYLETGVRLLSSQAAIDLFFAVEHRIDADAFEGRPRTWAMLGFRLLDN